jgi:hypothetical protein
MPKNTKSRRDQSAPVALVPAVGDDAYPYRLTGRFTERQWKALQSECHKRRMEGQRTNAADLLRVIVDDWLRSQAS